MIDPHHRHPLFFPISMRKLIVMSVATLGVYEFYWFYKNWQLVKHRTGRKIMPFWRAVFDPIYCLPLFVEVKDVAETHGAPVRFSPYLLAAIWVASVACFDLPDPYCWLGALSVLALLPVQKAVNGLNARIAPAHHRNANFTKWNIATIVVGGLFWVLIIIGSFMPA